jgi:GDPmannose 4,6-dehydratase
MVGVYRERSRLFACSAILFNHDSPRRGPKFVTRKITRAAAPIKTGLDETLSLGNLEATRDWGYAADYVLAMWQMLQSKVPEDYVIATGTSHSVREFCQVAFGHVGLDYREYVHTSPQGERAPDSIQLVGNAAKAEAVLGWRRTVSFEQLIHSMVDADIASLQPRSASSA